MATFVLQASRHALLTTPSLASCAPSTCHESMLGGAGIVKQAYMYSKCLNSALAKQHMSRALLHSPSAKKAAAQRRAPVDHHAARLHVGEQLPERLPVVQVQLPQAVPGPQVRPGRARHLAVHAQARVIFSYCNCLSQTYFRMRMSLC